MSTLLGVVHDATLSQHREDQQTQHDWPPFIPSILRHLFLVRRNLHAKKWNSARTADRVYVTIAPGGAANADNEKVAVGADATQTCF